MARTRNARLYDPKLAWFLSADPIASTSPTVQGLNRYAYAWNNPGRFTDPSGLYGEGSGGSPPPPLPPIWGSTPASAPIRGTTGDATVPPSSAREDDEGAPLRSTFPAEREQARPGKRRAHQRTSCSPRDHRVD